MSTEAVRYCMSGHRNPADYKYCPSCGAAILTMPEISVISTRPTEKIKGDNFSLEIFEVDQLITEVRIMDGGHCKHVLRPVLLVLARDGEMKISSDLVAQTPHW